MDAHFNGVRPEQALLPSCVRHSAWPSMYFTTLDR